MPQRFGSGSRPSSSRLLTVEMLEDRCLLDDSHSIGAPPPLAALLSAALPAHTADLVEGNLNHQDPAPVSDNAAQGNEPASESNPDRGSMPAPLEDTGVDQTGAPPSGPGVGNGPATILGEQGTTGDFVPTGSDTTTADHVPNGHSMPTSGEIGTANDAGSVRGENGTANDTSSAQGENGAGNDTGWGNGENGTANNTGSVNGEAGPPGNLVPSDGENGTANDAGSVRGENGTANDTSSAHGENGTVNDTTSANGEAGAPGNLVPSSGMSGDVGDSGPVRDQESTIGGPAPASDQNASETDTAPFGGETGPTDHAGVIGGQVSTPDPLMQARDAVSAPGDWARPDGLRDSEPTPVASAYGAGADPAAMVPPYISASQPALAERALGLGSVVTPGKASYGAPIEPDPAAGQVDEGTSAPGSNSRLTAVYAPLHPGWPAALAAPGDWQARLAGSLPCGEPSFDGGAAALDWTDLVLQPFDVLTDLPPIGLPALELGWQQCCDQLVELASSLAGSHSGVVLATCLLALAAAAIAGEIARQQLRQAPLHLDWAATGGKGAAWCLDGAGLAEG